MTAKRTAIMISGRGTNMSRLIEAAAEPSYPAEIVGVISDTPDAPGILFAASRGVETRVVPRSDYSSREAHDGAIHAALEAFDTEIVCLAGYLRMLTARFVEKWPGRMINIHPALLPSFKGLDTHRRALDAGVRIHGCTVHFVTPEMDEGAIIAQAAVPVLLADTEETLSDRVLKAEHQLYPLALQLVAEEKVRMLEGRAVFSGLHENDKDGLARLFSPSSWSEDIDLEALARSTP
jgi:phosphoribosylglycinamide formyltransferase 1